MRPLQILYGILLKYFEADQAKNNPRNCGICGTITECDELTLEEIRRLRQDFFDNRPGMNKHEFFFDPRREKAAFWWELGKYGAKIRVSFLKHMIKYHENNTTTV